MTTNESSKAVPSMPSVADLFDRKIVDPLSLMLLVLAIAWSSKQGLSGKSRHAMHPVGQVPPGRSSGLT